MKTQITIILGIAISAFIAVAAQPEQRGKSYDKPFKFRLVAGTADGTKFSKPVIITEDGTVIVADQAELIENKILRLEGDPEIRKGEFSTWSADPKAWAELDATGGYKTGGAWTMEGKVKK